MNKELSILFLDIRGFTSLSEKLTPQEVVDFLNTMFDLITEKALDNHGTIDKFIGDAAMIIFNAPARCEQSSLLCSQDGLLRFKRAWKKCESAFVRNIES